MDLEVWNATIKLYFCYGVNGEDKGLRYLDGVGYHVYFGVPSFKKAFDRLDQVREV